MTLKELLGDSYKEELTHAEIDALLKDKKLADLSTGRYVDKDKYDKTVRERDEAKQSLTDANEKYKDYDSLKEYHEKGVKAEKDKEIKAKLTEAGVKDEFLDYVLYQLESGKIDGKDEKKIVENTKTWLTENKQYAKEQQQTPPTPPTPNKVLPGTNLPGGDGSGNSGPKVISTPSWNKNRS